MLDSRLYWTHGLALKDAQAVARRTGRRQRIKVTKARIGAFSDRFARVFEVSEVGT